MALRSQNLYVDAIGSSQIGFRNDAFGGAEGNKVPIVHHGHLAGMEERMVRIVGCQDDGQSCTGKLINYLQNQGLISKIKGRCRLVHQDDVRPLGYCSGDGDKLSFPAAYVGEFPIPQMGNPDSLQGLFGDCCIVCTGDETSSMRCPAIYTSYG